MANKKKNIQTEDRVSLQNGILEEKTAPEQEIIPEGETVSEQAEDIGDKIMEAVEDLAAAETGEVTEDADGKKEKTVSSWMSGLKDSLESLAEKAGKGKTDEDAVEGEEGEAEPVLPARTKDDMQRELEEMKSGFEHTPYGDNPGAEGTAGCRDQRGRQEG